MGSPCARAPERQDCKAVTTPAATRSAADPAEVPVPFSWARARFDDLARWTVYLMVFVTPLVFSQSGVTVFYLPKLAMVWCLAWAGLALSWLHSLANAGTARIRSWVLRAALLYLGVAAVATITSDYLPVPVIGMYGRYQGLIAQVLMVAVLLLVIRSFRARPAELDTLLRFAVAGAGLAACYVLIQEAGLDWMMWNELSFSLTTNPRGTLGNSNFMGAYLAIVAPLCLYLLTTASRPAVRELYAATLGLMLLALWYTATRGGMLAAAVGGGVLLVANRKAVLNQIRRLGKVRVLAVLAVLGIVAIIVVINPLQNQSRGARDLLRSATLEQRVERWTAGVQAISQHPWLGTGPGTFYAVYPPNRGPEKEVEILSNNAHNIFVEHAAGKGLVGLAAYLLLLATAIGFAVRQARRQTGRERFRIVALGAALAAYLTQGLVSIDVIGLALLGWVLIGTLAAQSHPLGPAASPAASPRLETSGPRRSSKRQLLGGSAVVVSISILVLLAAPPLAADHAARAARSASTIDELQDRYDLARRLNPWEAHYPLQHGGFLGALATGTGDVGQASELFAQAESALREGLRLRPGSLEVVMELATLYQRWGEKTGDIARFRQAGSLWDRARAMDPQGYTVLNGYAETLAAWSASVGGDPGLRARRIKALEESLRILPGQEQTAARLAEAYAAAGRPEDADAVLTEVFSFPLDNDQRAAVAASELSDRRLRAIVGQWADDPGGRSVSALIGEAEEPRTVTQSRWIRLITIGVVMVVLLSAIALTKRWSPEASEKEEDLFLSAEAGAIRALLSPGGLRWLVVPGLWSAALALPRLPFLWTDGRLPGSLIELVAHGVPAVVLLMAAAVFDRRGLLKPGADPKPVRAGLLGLALAMIALHIPPLANPLDGFPTWSLAVMHLLPAVLTAVIAQPRIWLWLRPAQEEPPPSPAAT